MSVKQVTIISSGQRPDVGMMIREVLDYRHLISLLSYRDIRIRYAQTWLGIAWALINPLITVGLLYFVFSIVTRVDTQGVPSIVYMLAGLCVWSYFSRTVGDAGQSFIGGQSLVKKVYFPRIIIPVSKAISGLIDLGIVLIILFILFPVYHIPLHSQMLMVIPFLLLTILASLAVGVWMSALTIRFRDFVHIMPLLLRIGLFISPVAYGTVSVPESYQYLYQLNPLSGIISGMRWALFDTPMAWQPVWVSILVILIVLVSGIWYFRRMERFIADII